MLYSTWFPPCSFIRCSPLSAWACARQSRAVWRREREEKRRVVSKLQQGETEVEEKGEGEPLGDSQGPGVEMLLLMLLFPAVAAAIPMLVLCKKTYF